MFGWFKKQDKPYPWRVTETVNDYTKDLKDLADQVTEKLTTLPIEERINYLKKVTNEW